MAKGKLPGRAEERAPDDPTELSKQSWKETLKRTFKEFQDDGLTDWAAALTYYGVLALFPALIALISIIGPQEAFRIAQIQSAADFNYTPLLAAALLYLSVTVPLARLLDIWSRRRGEIHA